MRLVVVDDEPPARRAIQIACREHAGVEIVGEASSVAEALPLIEAERPDAVILDVTMPGEEGFHLIRQLEFPLPIIIYTGHANRALEAFEAEAFDFLLKPLDPARFSRILWRLRRSVPRPQPPAEIRGKPESAAPLRVSNHRGYRLLHPDNILAVEAEKDFCRILLTSGEMFFASQSIGRMQEKLMNPPFLRLGRSLIINYRQVDRIEPLDNSRANVRFRQSTASLNIGRAALSVLKRSL
ncbi:MAG: LytTR family DNA-binding domain-containing protein [Ancalomicrobiaceae bacterium]|nr:LytTR family DNA-binding domain-containing protein [Ancalomicrobiaceae bacterium]